MLVLEKTRLDSKEKKEYGPEPKRYREYPPACILDCCYVADADNVELTSPIDLESWKTLVSAAQIRNNQPVLDIVFNTNDEQIRKVSIEKGDRKIIALVSRELVAAEAHYHRSCYKEYTRTDDCKNIKDERKMELSEYETTETQAYEMLCQYIREDLISNPRVIKFTELITKLSFYMSNLGVLRITDSTQNNLRRRLDTTFGTLLHFEKEIEGKRPLVVFPDNLTKLNLICDNIRLQKQIELKKHLSRKFRQRSTNSFVHLPKY